MKTRILIALASAMALASTATAQNVHYGENFELNSTLNATQSHEYIANSYINLNEGFYSEPKPGNHTSLQLDSEGYGINPPEEGLTNSGGCVVGSLGGTVNVGAMGGLLYTIPLELPSGINGIQPKLSITYNSQAGNGLMGWGWDLDGLSSITRTGQTLYHDGRMTAANISENDRFLLDGKRLIEVADYTDSTEYRLEQDEMSKVMAYFRYEQVGGLFGHGVVKILDRFVVWKADGLVMKYGATQNSWINPQNGGYDALCWLLSEVSDRNGNAVKYHYHEEQSKGTYLVDTIAYTANVAQNVPAQFSVTFEYQDNRTDRERCFIAGNLVQMKHLLKSITVFSKTGNKCLIKYEFNYTQNNNRHYNILIKACMKAYDEEGSVEKINETTFEWNTLSPTQLVQYTISNPGIFDEFPFTGDFNGDGYMDVALVPYKDSSVYHNPVTVCVYLNDRNLGFERESSMDITAPVSLDWIHVLDINGDGVDDMALYLYDTIPSSGSETTSVRVYLNNPSTQSFNYLGYKEIGNKGDVITGDFNGDGNSDIILLEKTFEETAINQGIGWYETIPFIENAYFIGYLNSTFHTIKLNSTSLEDLGPAYDVVAADYNGDGTSEVLLVGIYPNVTSNHGSKICRFDLSGENNGCAILQQFQAYHNLDIWNPFFSGDFNGDGKADLIYFLYGWYVCFSEGDSMGTPLEILGAGELPAINYHVNLYYPSLRIVENISHTYSKACVVADFDGDGCSDFGIVQEASSTMYFATRIAKSESNYAMFRKRFQSSCNVAFRSQFIHVGNYLGMDNMAFLCLTETAGEGKSDVPTIVSLRPVSQFNSLISVTDGLGNKTKFTYDYLTPKPTGTANPFYTYNYAVPNAHGVRPAPLPIRALKTYSVEGINDSKSITKYSYSNAWYHKDGHGFLGFSTTIAETYHNSTDSLWTTRKVCLNETSTMGQYAMMLPQRETTYINDNGYIIPINKIRYSFTNVKFASGLTDLVVCPAMTGRIEEIYSMDEDDELIATDTTFYQYNYNSNYTYNNAYGCTNTTQTFTEFDSGSPVTELQTVKQTTSQTIVSSWIVNRPLTETVTQTRNGQSVSTHTMYSYVSNRSYQPLNVMVVPNDGSLPHDPLTLLTSYDYDAFGNVIETVTSAPYGIHNEVPRITSYEYGSAYQHRLLTKKTIGRSNSGYVTDYTYDFHDRLASATDCNGKQTAYSSSVLGTLQSVLPPDGTEQRSLTLWATESPYKPTGASYYTWSKKTGGVTAMTFYHKSGVELRRVTFDFQGKPVYTDRRYNAKGLLESVSAPYLKGELAENIQWTVYHYDAHDRITRIDNPDGSAKTFAYNGLETSTTVTPPSGSPVMTPQTTVTKTNALGWLRESVDADGTSVFYEYYADGNLKWTRIGNNESTKISMVYDHAGNRTRLHDPDYCTAQKDLVSVYNAFGEEVSRTTPKDNLTTFAYDGFGRMTERVEEDEVEPGVVEVRNTSWNYSETVPQKGLLLSVTHPEQTTAYAYDTCQRVICDTVRFPGGETHVTRYTYDQASRIASVAYPSGVIIDHRYNAVGYPSAQLYKKNDVLYKTQGTTPAGQVERFTLGGVLANTLEYDSERLLLTRVKTQKNGSIIQNFSYTYDGFCNLASRTDHMKSITETFGYDSQNRLTGVWLGATQTGASAYDGYGRMTSKTAGGQPVFSNAVYTTTAKPHAMDAATTAEGVFPATDQTVAYTSFDKVSKVKQGNDSLCYTYGYDHQRIFMEEHVGITSRTKRYVGNCEYITETNGNITDTQWLTYLSGPTGVYAVVMTKSGSDQIFYVLKDNLGSWTAITDENGTVEQRLSYDAWGNLRNPNTWSGSFNDMPLFDRGFTGHEHLHNFGLINMNGRMYDPLMSSFLSVDQYVQSPDNAQGFNRYAYCLNNPLRYVDPSGWRAGGGNTGYFPNSSANAFDPYAFYGGHIPLEPRDICGIGVRTEVATALLATFMYGKKISVGGTVAFGDDGKICDIDLTLRFNINQLNQSLPAGVIGKCVLAGLGSTMKYWQNDKGGNWGDGTKQWLKKAEKYMEQTGNDFSDPKYLIDFIQWNDANAKNAFKSYEATFIPLSEVPKAISDGYVVAACSEIIREADIQINLGRKGHFANVSRIKVSNGSIELDFIEPEGTNIMNTFKSSSLFFYETPPYLYNISFVKYRLKP